MDDINKAAVRLDDINKAAVRVEAHIITYNEERMIAHTLNHYSKFCSRIFIYDNCSSDRTRTIASSYPMVTIKEFSTGNKFNDRTHLEIKNSCWKNSAADFVITADCDEFLYAEDLIEKLQVLKSQGVTLPGVTGFNMYCEYFPADYTRPIMEQVKTGVRAVHFDKQIIFSPRLKEINFGPGAHTCSPVGRLIRNNAVGLKLLHYKYLSYEGVRNRHEHYNLRMSTFNKENNFGGEYAVKPDENFELIKQSAKEVIQ